MKTKTLKTLHFQPTTKRDTVLVRLVRHSAKQANRSVAAQLREILEAWVRTEAQAAADKVNGEVERLERKARKGK